MTAKAFEINEDGSVSFRDAQPSEQARREADKAVEAWRKDRDEAAAAEAAKMREKASRVAADTVQEQPVSDEREKGV